MPIPQKTKKVRILFHPGTPLDEKGEPRHISGVQTSDGDKYHGDVAELPELEAKMLIASKRAEEFVEPKKKTAAA